MRAEDLAPGAAQGRIEEARYLIRKLLTWRLAILPARIEARIDSLPLEELSMKSRPPRSTPRASANSLANLTFIKR